ncbi:hypothetical protein [Paraflavitalea pollutisoli]|uniref:hypothetical protein n=1 Tax=Paraflavitalea pollutisoli TaxID=3034143 RepID=UPI0023ED9BC2|nr:hypothetical protein [Paraflavitalea sp. H1-2-19X]
METTDLQAALIDVRKAYRLLYMYQRRLVDTVDYISQSIGVQIENTYCCFSGSFFDGRKHYRDYWAWDWLPMYFHEFYCGAHKRLNGLVINVGIAIQSDTGFYDAQLSNKQNIEAYAPVEDSETRLLFYLARNGWKQDFPEFEKLWERSQRTFALTKGDKQFAAIALPLSDFMHETLIHASLKIVAEFFQNNGFPEFMVGEGIRKQKV